MYYARLVCIKFKPKPGSKQKLANWSEATDSVKFQDLT